MNNVMEDLSRDYNSHLFGSGDKSGDKYLKWEAIPLFLNSKFAKERGNNFFLKGSNPELNNCNNHSYMERTQEEIKLLYYKNGVYEGFVNEYNEKDIFGVYQWDTGDTYIGNHRYR